MRITANELEPLASSTAAPIKLIQDQAKTVLKKSQVEIVQIMMTSITVPHCAKQKEMYLDAILASIWAVVEGAAAGPPAHYEQMLSLAMRDV